MTKKQEGEQQPLIDVGPENMKEIVTVAKLYKKHMTIRQAALMKEIAKKQELLNLVKAAKLKPLEGGVIKFKVDGLTIKITPRDELVQVKEDSPE